MTDIVNYVPSGDGPVSRRGQMRAGDVEMVAVPLSELQSLRAQVRDLTHRAQMWEAAYGNGQHDLAQARGQVRGGAAPLADALIRSLGLNGAEDLHRELGDILMARAVSGA